MNLTAVLAKIPQFLWKKTRVDIGSGLENAFFFDLRRADDYTLQDFQDTMDDLEPEELNLEYVIPVGVVGTSAGNEVDASEYGDGVFHMGQYAGILFVNLKEATGGKAPVYTIDVDGNIIPDTYRRVADDLTDLGIQLVE